MAACQLGSRPCRQARIDQGVTRGETPQVELVQTAEIFTRFQRVLALPETR